MDKRKLLGLITGGIGISVWILNSFIGIWSDLGGLIFGMVGAGMIGWCSA